MRKTPRPTKMIEQIDKYWAKLFVDPITVSTPFGPVRIQRKILQTFGIMGDFDPYAMTARQALGLIKTLAEKKQRALALAESPQET